MGQRLPEQREGAKAPPAAAPDPRLFQMGDGQWVRLDAAKKGSGFGAQPAPPAPTYYEPEVPAHEPERPPPAKVVHARGEWPAYDAARDVILRANPEADLSRVSAVETILAAQELEKRARAKEVERALEQTGRSRVTVPSLDEIVTTPDARKVSGG